MKSRYTVALVMLAGAALGALAIQALHAQAKPPAYLVVEVDVTDADLYKEYQSKAIPLVSQYSGRIIARNATIDAFAGESPKRAVIAAIAVFDSLEKVQAFRDSPAYKELIPLRDKASKYRGYIIEGSEN